MSSYRPQYNDHNHSLPPRPPARSREYSAAHSPPLPRGPPPTLPPPPKAKIPGLPGISGIPGLFPWSPRHRKRDDELPRESPREMPREKSREKPRGKDIGEILRRPPQSEFTFAGPDIGSRLRFSPEPGRRDGHHASSRRISRERADANRRNRDDHRNRDDRRNLNSRRDEGRGSRDRPRRLGGIENPRGRGYRNAGRATHRPPTSDRPLLSQRHRTDDDAAIETVGVPEGMARYLDPDDISDSSEAEMELSSSETERDKINQNGIRNQTTSIGDQGQVDGEGNGDGGGDNDGDGNGQADGGPLSKRAATGLGIKNGDADTIMPKWSNPDPYYVLPPIDESLSRRRKDPVKQIRKSRKAIADKTRIANDAAMNGEGEESEMKEVTLLPKQAINQVAANEDFISFDLVADNVEEEEEQEQEEEEGDLEQEQEKEVVEARDEINQREKSTVNGSRPADTVKVVVNVGPRPVRLSDTPTTIYETETETQARQNQGPDPSSDEKNKRKQEKKKITDEDINNKIIIIDDDDGDDKNQEKEKEKEKEKKATTKFVLDTAEPSVIKTFSQSVDDFLLDVDPNLGNRKRTYDDEIKGAVNRYKSRKVFPSGCLLDEWTPKQNINPVPWLCSESHHLNSKPGFRLHKEICDFFDYIRPKDYEQVIRARLLARLQSTIREEIGDCDVQCFGSYAAGLYLPTADMDLVVLSASYNDYGEKVICQSNSKMHKFGTFLSRSGLAQPDSVDVIIGAKVPLVKFVDRLTNIRVDLSFENDSGLVANKTFSAWKEEFPAMPVLVTLLKQFLLMRGLNEVVSGGLGGFSVTCLVVSMLQNMPRVQSRELLPEEHLGEMLIEFLDFYGNQFDIARTGITMQPPGYFDKQAYYRPRFRGPVYSSDSFDRITIIDPNSPDHDISGGSSNVGAIFNRFARAHREILLAMQAGTRQSLLDWFVGGNYSSFVQQREFLRQLYNNEHAG